MPDRKFTDEKLLASQTTAMTLLTKEKVQFVTLNTIIFDPLRDPFLQRHDVHD
tara:strand:+ start:1951 stop:2109 length:159 start_codon:yes stop_codon:yes gene_type:complete